MGQYIYTLVAAAVFTAVIVAISPGGDGGKTGKLVAFIGALAMALTMLSPIPSLLEEEVGLSDIPSQKAEENEENTAEYYANSAGMALSEIYGTDISEIKAEVTCTAGEVAKITLYLDEAPYYSTDEAGEVLSEIYGFDIEVRKGDKNG